MGHPEYAQDAADKGDGEMATARSTSKKPPSDPLVQVLVDTREPEWVRALSFGGAHVIPALIEAGDLLAMTASGTPILIERKTAGDLLASIKDGRLIAQAAVMRQMSEWAYLVITEPMYPGRFGQVLFQPVQGAHPGPARDRVGLARPAGGADHGAGPGRGGGLVRGRRPLRGDRAVAVRPRARPRRRPPPGGPAPAGGGGHPVRPARRGAGAGQGVAAGVRERGLGAVRPDRGARRRQVQEERDRGGA